MLYDSSEDRATGDEVRETKLLHRSLFGCISFVTGSLFVRRRIIAPAWKLHKIPIHRDSYPPLYSRNRSFTLVDCCLPGVRTT